MNCNQWSRVLVTREGKKSKRLPDPSPSTQEPCPSLETRKTGERPTSPRATSPRPSFESVGRSSRSRFESRRSALSLCCPCIVLADAEGCVVLSQREDSVAKRRNFTTSSADSDDESPSASGEAAVSVLVVFFNPNTILCSLEPSFLSHPLSLRLLLPTPFSYSCS